MEAFIWSSQTGSGRSFSISLLVFFGLLLFFLHFSQSLFFSPSFLGGTRRRRLEVKNSRRLAEPLLQRGCDSTQASAHAASVQAASVHANCVHAAFFTALTSFLSSFCLQNGFISISTLSLNLEKCLSNNESISLNLSVVVADGVQKADRNETNTHTHTHLMIKHLQTEVVQTQKTHATEKC